MGKGLFQSVEWVCCSWRASGFPKLIWNPAMLPNAVILFVFGLSMKRRMSRAYAISFCWWVSIFMPWKVSSDKRCLISWSRATLKSKGENGHPCLFPCFIKNLSELSLFVVIYEVCE